MNESFTFLDGLSVSLFSMTVVFVVLLLLSFILGLFSKILDKYAKDAPVETIKPVQNLEDDEEELLVVKIITSCLLQGEEGSNIKINSIKRIK